MLRAATKAIGHPRARSLQDKDLRRHHLIEAAAQLFAEGDFDSVTIARVAELAGVAKGTAYLYFATKEALFLELVRAELSGWFDALSQRLERMRSSQPASAVPQAMARVVAQRPVLRRLLVLLHGVIEPHIDQATARAFKLYLADLLLRVSTLIARKIPGFTREDAVTLVLQNHALVISLTQLSQPPPVIAQVLAADPALQSMLIDFEPFLAHTLRTLVRGMLARK